jgi:RecA/RadA recombinase
MTQDQGTQATSNKGPVKVSNLLHARSKELQDLRLRKARGEKIRLTVPTGFPAFDAVYGGLPRGRVTVLGADTGVGKSSIARALSYSAASVGAVLLFNLEDGNQNFADKILGEQTGEGSLQLEKLEFDPTLGRRLDAAAQQAVFDKIYIDEETYDPREQAQVALRTNAVTPLSLVIIDYVQLVRVKQGSGKQEGIMDALAFYQWLAKKCDCAVLVLSQVTTKQISHRGWEYYFNAKNQGVKGDALYEGYVPLRGDFAWASELDQLGKMVISAFRAGPYRKEHGDGQDEDKFIHLYMLKVNNGPGGKRFSIPWNAKLSQVGVG